jgi:hypothetical protein
VRRGALTGGECLQSRVHSGGVKICSEGETNDRIETEANGRFSSLVAFSCIDSRYGSKAERGDLQ